MRPTVIRVITAHLQPGAAVSWPGCNFDFTGIIVGRGTYTGGAFTGAVFSGGLVDFGGAEFPGGPVSPVRRRLGPRSG